jgi:acetolactate synthase I/II/III large subunit
LELGLTIKLSDYVIQFVADQGVKHIFMLPGGGAMHLNDSVGRCKEIEFVCNLHEQACAIAAEAYAQVTNNLGVALVTTGPGGTNAITGVAAAWLDSAPCLFLSGQVKRTDLKGDLGIRQLGVQEIDIISLVQPITKYAVTILDPNTIKYHLEKAVFLAKSGRPGPVWIDIPLDVQATPIELDNLVSFHNNDKIQEKLIDTDLELQVTQTIQLLNHAERPVVLIGNGVRLAGVQEEILDLISKLGLPAMTTWMGIDLIPYNNELLIGSPGSLAPRGVNFALQNSDFLLIIGARMDMAMIGYAPDKLARGAQKIMVDIDPGEIRKLKGAINLPICANARDFVTEFQKQFNTITNKDRSSWVTRCKDWKSKYPVVLPEHRNQTELTTYYFSEILAQELNSGDLIAPGSAGVAVEIFFQVFRVKSNQRVFHDRGLGSMGFGLPASIGACLASGRKRTISVEGDGSFQMNIQELETVARLNLPIKFFVINNGGFASIRASQQRSFGQLTGADMSSGLTLPDLVRIASAYGLSTARIISTNDLQQHIKDVLQTPGPTVCEVVVQKDEVCIPRLSSIQRADGSIVSKPLEDMWPFLERQEFVSNMIIPPLNE